MTVQTASHSASSAPQAGAAMASIATAACQRACALHLSTLEQLMQPGSKRTDSGVSVAGDGMSALPSMMSPPAIEPMLRYAAGLFEIYQSATKATADLLTAQLQGEQQRVDALADQARSQADAALKDAASAAGSVFNAGLEAANRLTSAAARMDYGLAAQAAEAGALRDSHRTRHAR